MKKVFFLAIMLIGLTNCVMEAPPTWYIFKIKNKYKDTIFINYKTIEDSYQKKDTILPNKEFTKILLTPMQCFVDYKDSLISHFFNHLELNINGGGTSKDIKDYKNWDFISNLKSKGKCLWDTCYYEYYINESDLTK